MSPTPPTGDVVLFHCVDAELQSTGGKIELETPAGPLTMMLPPGLVDGETLRLAGRGKPGPDGKRGDVLLTVTFFQTGAPPVLEDREIIMTAIPLQEDKAAPSAVAVAGSSTRRYWSARSLFDLMAFLCITGLPLALAANSRAALPASIYVIGALVVAWTCQLLLILDMKHLAFTRARIEGLRVLRVVLATSLVVGVAGAHLRDEWPFREAAETSRAGYGQAGKTSAASSPIARKSGLLGDVLAFFFFNLVLPILPALIFIFSGKVATLRRLRLVDLSSELLPPVNDPLFGPLKWNRNEGCWAGETRLAGDRCRLKIKTACIGAPTETHRDAYRSVAARFAELRERGMKAGEGTLRMLGLKGPPDQIAQKLKPEWLLLDDGGDAGTSVKMAFTPQGSTFTFLIAVRGDEVSTPLW